MLVPRGHIPTIKLLGSSKNFCVAQKFLRDFWLKEGVLFQTFHVFKFSIFLVQRFHCARRSCVKIQPFEKLAVRPLWCTKLGPNHFPKP